MRKGYSVRVSGNRAILNVTTITQLQAVEITITIDKVRHTLLMKVLCGAVIVKTEQALY
jgi:hypothetical protein